MTAVGRERERERERIGWTSLSANLSESHVRWCAHPRTPRDGGGAKRDASACARVPCIMHVHIALTGQRWLTGRPQAAKSTLSLRRGQCENELGYRLRAMRFIKPSQTCVEMDPRGWLQWKLAACKHSRLLNSRGSHVAIEIECNVSGVCKAIYTRAVVSLFARRRINSLPCKARWRVKAFLPLEWPP